ncbi:hypothetical protein [Halomarina ordinaria]|uniref:DUF7981 domain-containing protein n=1 Tax=Halomarina ordinaria TaxID=3033939 RepID=A0ABD5U9M5_9EURY|nr:hypothetical protein [Halomarina sp. PSRA2]
MRPRTRASLLWGIIGALSFLVLAQGYRLFGGDPIDASVLVGVAVVVGVAASVATYVADGFLHG